MRFLDSFLISLRLLRNNWLRSLLTISGVGVAIALIVFLVGLGYGIQQLTIGSIISSQNLLSLDIAPPADSSFALDPSRLQQVKAIPQIKDATAVVSTSGQITINGRAAAVAVIAADPSYLAMQGIVLSKGAPYNSDKATVVLSAQAVTLLETQPGDLVGHTLSFSYLDPSNQNQAPTAMPVEVTGVSQDTDVPTVYFPYSLLTASAQKSLSSIKAVGSDQAGVVAAQATLANENYQVTTLVDTLDQAKQVFRWATLVLALFGLVAVVVASEL